MYRIMYRHNGMHRTASAVEFDATINKLVEANFTSEEVAEEYRQQWFISAVPYLQEGGFLESRVERVRPSVHCPFTVVA